MKLSAIFLPMLLGCAPDFIVPTLNRDGSPAMGDTAEDTADAAISDGAHEVAVPDVSEDAPISEDVVVLPDTPDVVRADVGADVDVVETSTPDADVRDTGGDVQDVADVQDVRDVADVRDVQDASDAEDVREDVREETPVVPLDLGPPPCLPGLDRCGGSVCINLSTDIANCGGCGNACPARPHAPATCMGGSCALVCDPGTLNCDGNLTNGCETTPSTDVSNCGACGMACQSFPHTAPSLCVGGVCSFGCGAGYANCDGLAVNGCEVSTATDPMNCGACGRACGAGQTCAAGTCVCPSGQALCGGVCSNLASDRFNCGTCGTRCPSPTTCNSGVCGCTGGRVFCPRDAICADLSSDPNNCGWCRNICPGAARRCVNSHCTA